jgi:hypothetical protein
MTPTPATEFFAALTDLLLGADAHPRPMRHTMTDAIEADIMKQWTYVLPTPADLLVDLAEMCEEAATEMLHPDHTSDCARSYLRAVQQLADDIYASCPNKLFGGEPIAMEFLGRDHSGPIIRPMRALHSLVRHAVAEINIDYGCDGDVADDFREAAQIVRAVIAKVQP